MTPFCFRIACFIALIFSGGASAQELAEVAKKVNFGLGRVLIVSGNNHILGTGSGFVVNRQSNSDLLFVTNQHVAPKRSNRYVVGFLSEQGLNGIDGARYALYKGELIAADPDRDLALLRLRRGPDSPQMDVRPLEIFGGELGQGLEVASFGYPGIADGSGGRNDPQFYQSSLTSGVISRVSKSDTWSTRDSKVDVEVIHHDAAINRGNSGGPLVNNCGQVLGVNTMLRTQSTGGREVYIASSAQELINFLSENNVSYQAINSECEASGSTNNFGGGFLQNLSELELGLLITALAAVALGGGVLVAKRRQSGSGGSSRGKGGERSLCDGSRSAVEVGYESKTGQKRKVGLTKSQLSSGVSIGRESANDITIDDPKVSRRHAILELRDRKLMLRDLEAANGTFVDGKRLEKSGSRQINSKSKILVGGTRLYLRKP